MEYEINVKDFRDNRPGNWLDIRMIKDSKVALSFSTTGNETDSNTINRNEKEAKVGRNGCRGKLMRVEDGRPRAQVLLQVIVLYAKLQVLTILCP